MSCNGLLSFLFFLLFIQPILATSYCGTIANDSLSDSRIFEPQSGGASLLKFALKRPWPRVGKLKQRTIPYCYADALTRTNLHCSVMQGLGIWSAALGTNRVNGHSLSWWQTSSRTPPALYSKKEECYTKDGKWNDRVPRDALAIHISENGVPQATVGNTPENQDGSAGRHKLHLPVDTRPPVIAHEFGHVFGMVHEQCRNDRVAFIEYRCENIKGYDRASTAALLSGDPDWRERLCDDKDFANEFNFDSAQFIKNFDSTVIPGMIDEGDFDRGSIMLYPSHAFSHPDCKSAKVNKCPLALIDKVNGKVTGKSYIFENAIPSLGDVAWVKKWYKWEDDMLEGHESTAEPDSAAKTQVMKRGVSVEENVQVHIFELLDGRDAVLKGIKIWEG
ncbi:hypothetical protein FB567DRAFT_452241 [Paraphoma chrysanthemicola]|uniref:Peptidase M12A domain-containing protein n=1 Tax=Paraphoma chrysanthemicola TaxID=798071 RepID=A0A8K0VU03_9PLEO|nr:hypothetical protein FB567DRAFT_452241 [Paraphoma chrysanthemicola]